MSVSAWGVEHSPEVSKALSRKEKKGILAGATLGPIGTAAVAPKGVKPAAALHGTAASYLGGPVGGGYAGYRAARGEGLAGGKLKPLRKKSKAV